MTTGDRIAGVEDCRLGTSGEGGVGEVGDCRVGAGGGGRVGEVGVPASVMVRASVPVTRLRMLPASLMSSYSSKSSKSMKADAVALLK